MQGNVYLLAGGGGNVIVQVGPSGVDHGGRQVRRPDRQDARRDQEALRRRTSRCDTCSTRAPTPIMSAATRAWPRRWGPPPSWEIINTPGATQTAVQIVAHDNVLSRMSKLPTTAWPTETFIGREKEFFFNGEPVFMYHIPAAHTDGDSIVFFRRSDVVATGDIFRTDSYPVIDLQKGGSVQGVHRRAEPRARPRRARASRGGRHVHRSGPRPHLRRVRRARISRHGHDHARPRPGDDQEGHDARRR